MCIFTSPRFGLLLTGAIFLIIFGSQLASILNQPGDIWWTPKNMMQPYSQDTERIEIYVRGESLPEVIDSGSLILVNGEDHSILTDDDIKVRFNNYDRIRAERLEMALAEAAFTGGSAVLVIFGLMAMLRKGLISSDDCSCGVKN